MKIIIVKSLVLSLLLVISCNTKKYTVADAESDISGLWLIDTIYYNNIIISNCMSSNLLSFSDDKTATLPIVSDFCNLTLKNLDIYVVSWNVKENNKILTLQMDGTNELFCGQFQIKLNPVNKQHIVRLQLAKGNTKILCHKYL